MTIFIAHLGSKMYALTRKLVFNSRDKQSQMKCQRFQRKLTAYYFKGLCSRGFGAFICWCESHFLSFVFVPSTQRKKAWTKEKIKYSYWSIHSFVLYSPETLTVKDLRKAEHFFLKLLSASFWQLARGDFPGGKLFSLKRSVYTRHAALQGKKALVFYNYFQHSCCEIVFTAEVCDWAITAHGQ